MLVNAWQRVLLSRFITTSMTLLYHVLRPAPVRISGLQVQANASWHVLVLTIKMRAPLVVWHVPLAVTVATLTIAAVASRGTCMCKSTAPVPRCVVWLIPITTQVFVCLTALEALSCWRMAWPVRNATLFVQNALKKPQIVHDVKVNSGTTTTVSTSAQVHSTSIPIIHVGNVLITLFSVLCHRWVTISRQK